MRLACQDGQTREGDAAQIENVYSPFIVVICAG